MGWEVELPLRAFLRPVHLHLLELLLQQVSCDHDAVSQNLKHLQKKNQRKMRRKRKNIILLSWSKLQKM
jgi:hypothetical protein